MVFFFHSTQTCHRVCGCDAQELLNMWHTWDARTVLRANTDTPCTHWHRPPNVPFLKRFCNTPIAKMHGWYRLAAGGIYCDVLQMCSLMKNVVCRSANAMLNCTGRTQITVSVHTPGMVVDCSFPNGLHVQHPSIVTDRPKMHEAALQTAIINLAAEALIYRNLEEHRPLHRDPIQPRRVTDTVNWTSTQQCNLCTIR